LGNEALVFVVMLATFVVLSLRLKLPIGVALMVASIAGGVIAGLGVPISHLVEGTFAYLDEILIIATAMLFMKGMQKSGLLNTAVYQILQIFHNKKVFLLLSMMALVMFPGLITGVSTPSVLTTGALVAPVLLHLGMSRSRAGAIIGMGSIFGMLAPPVNIPIMIIGAGIDMPYMGFTLPLLILIIPVAIFTTLFLGYRHIKIIPWEELKKGMPESNFSQYGWKLYLPIMFVVFVMLLEKSIPHVFPNLGLPLIFLGGSLLTLVTGAPFKFSPMSKESVKESLPIMALLAGIGMLIQIMTLTGARGFIVVNILTLPDIFLYLGIVISLPLFGAVSSFASATVLGIPFSLALLGQNEIWLVSAVAFVAGLGDLMPPTALAGIFAAKVVGIKKYSRILKHCIIPAILMAIYGLFVIIDGEFTNWLEWFFLGFPIITVVVLILIIFFVIKLIRSPKKEKEGTVLK